MNCMAFFYIYAGVPAYYLMRRVFENSWKFLPCIFPKCVFLPQRPNKESVEWPQDCGGGNCDHGGDGPTARDDCLFTGEEGRGATKGWLVVCYLLFLLFVVGYYFVDGFGGFLAAKKKIAQSDAFLLTGERVFFFHPKKSEKI